MVHPDQAPHFNWPANREILEADSNLSERPIIKATRNFLAEATKEIDPMITNAFKEKPFIDIGPDYGTDKEADTYSRSPSDILGELFRSTQKPPIQSSWSEEPPVETNLKSITETISKVISTEKPLFENGPSTLHEKTLRVLSEPPVLAASEFRINMNTNSSSTIDTMKDIFTEAISKERGVVLGEPSEKPISTTSITINTLRDMFMKAVAKEKPLLDTTESEHLSTNFSTSTERFSDDGAEIMRTERPLFGPSIDFGSHIKANSSSNMIADVVNGISSTEQPFVQITNNFEPLKDVATTLEESSIRLDSRTATDRTIDMISNIFDLPTSPQQKLIPNDDISEQTKGLLSTALQTEETSIEFGSNMQTNSSVDLIADVFNRTHLSEQPLIQTTDTNFVNGSTTVDYNNTFETLKDMLPTAFQTEEPSIEFGTSSQTNSSLNSITDVANPVQSTETFEALKDVVSTVEESSIQFDLRTMKNSTIDKISDIINASNTSEQEYSQNGNTFETMKYMLSTTLQTEEPPFNIGSSEDTNTSLNIVADVFNGTTPTEQPFVLTTDKIEALKNALSTSEESPLKFDLRTAANSTIDKISDIVGESTSTEQVYIQNENTFEKMKDVLSTTLQTEEPSINFGSSIQTNSSLNLIADVLNGTSSKERSFVHTSDAFEKLKDVVATIEDSSIKFDMKTVSNSTIGRISDIVNEPTLADQKFFQNEKTFEMMKDVLSTTLQTEEPSIDFGSNMQTNRSLNIIDVSNRTPLTGQPLIQTTDVFDALKDTMSIGKESQTQSHLKTVTDSFLDRISDIFNGSTTAQQNFDQNGNTFQNMKDIMPKTLQTEEPSIDLNIQTNSSLYVETDVFNGSTPMKQTFVDNINKFQEFRSMLSTTLQTEEPSIDFGSSIQTNNYFNTFEDIMNGTSTEPPLVQTQYTLEALKDATSSIKLDLRTVTNSTIHEISDIFNGSSSTEQIVFQTENSFETPKYVLPTTFQTEEFPIDFGANTNASSSLDLVLDVSNGTTPTEKPFVQITFEALKDAVTSVEEPPIKLKTLTNSTIENISDIFNRTTPIESYPNGKINSSIEILTDVFKGPTSTQPTFIQKINTFEKDDDMIPTSFGHTESTVNVSKSMFEKLKDVLSSTTEDATLKFDLRTETNSSIDIAADILNGSTSTEESSIVFGHDTRKTNALDVMIDLFHESTSTEKEIVRNTGTFEKIKGVLSTSFSTEKPSMEFSNNNLGNITVTNGSSNDLGISRKMSSSFDMIVDYINGSNPTEKTTSLNNSFALLQDNIKAVPSNESNVISNSTLSVVKDISKGNTTFHPSTNTLDLMGMFNRNASSEKTFNTELNHTLDVLTTEMSASPPIISGTNSPEMSFYSGSTNSTDSSLFQTNFTTSDTLIGKATTENSLFNVIESSNSISTARRSFGDVLSTMSSNISSTTDQVSGGSERQNQNDVESDSTLYMSLGVTLVVLIIFIVGGYIFCRKYKKHSKSARGYYITHLKDYSDSSVRTVFDDGTTNIKV